LGPSKSGITNCDIFPLTNRISIPFYGSVYYTPGKSNIGVPNFSESTISTGLIGLLPSWVAGDSNGDGIDDIGFIDGDGDGFLDFDFQDPFYNFQRSDYFNSGDFVRKNRRISAIVNGEYDLDDANDTTLFLLLIIKAPSFRIPFVIIFVFILSTSPRDRIKRIIITHNKTLARLKSYGQSSF